jgi:hypothetical protein
VSLCQHPVPGAQCFGFFKTNWPQGSVKKSGAKCVVLPCIRGPIFHSLPSLLFNKVCFSSCKCVCVCVWVGGWVCVCVCGWVRACVLASVRVRLQASMSEWHWPRYQEKIKSFELVQMKKAVIGVCLDSEDKRYYKSLSEIIIMLFRNNRKKNANKKQK